MFLWKRRFAVDDHSIIGSPRVTLVSVGVCSRYRPIFPRLGSPLFAGKRISYPALFGVFIVVIVLPLRRGNDVNRSFSTGTNG